MVRMLTVVVSWCDIQPQTIFDVTKNTVNIHLLIYRYSAFFVFKNKYVIIKPKKHLKIKLISLVVTGNSSLSCSKVPSCLVELLIHLDSKLMVLVLAPRIARW